MMKRLLIVILLCFRKSDHITIDSPENQHNPERHPELFQEIPPKIHSENNKKSAEKKDGGHNVPNIFSQLVRITLLTEDYCFCSLKVKGITTQTATGPWFMIAGVNLYCIAASTAAWSNIWASLFRTTAL